jgi:serine/threonine protein kinase
VDAYGFTPSYGAPEQFSKTYGITGPWTDVFALALILVELVTGKEPLGNGTAEQMTRIATDPDRRPTPRAMGAKISDAVERVFSRALSVLPAERWQTVGTFWHALHEAMAVVEAPARVSVTPIRPSGRPRALMAFRTAVGLAALLFAIAMSAVSDVGPPPTARGAGPANGAPSMVARAR